MFELTPAEWEALQLSLKVAFWSVLCSLPLAVAVAMLLARSNFPGKSLFDASCICRWCYPVVVGYFLLLLLGRRGPLGALLEEYFGIVVAFRWTGAAIAAAIMGFPLMVRAIRLSVEAVDKDSEAAARTLGASRWRVFFTVTLPLTLPGILTGVLLSFARSLGGSAHDYVSFNIPGETRNAAAGDLYSDPGSGW
jgi:molybdate transport system permease protein